MPLQAPNLDQRTFEQLVTEVRRRIPTFTPEWTDLNDSDPGITLAQLFAFMSEQLLFQTNQVPPKGLITFLKLVGAELHPPTPAIADVTFVPIDASAPALIEIPEGTQVQTTAPPPGATTPVTFETRRRFFAVSATIEAVGSVNCDGVYSTHTAVNAGASGRGTVNIGGFLPFGLAQSSEDALLLALDLQALGQWPEGTIRLRVEVAGSNEVGQVLVPSGAPAEPPRVEWSYSVGTTTSGGVELVAYSSRLEPTLDTTSEFTRNGYIELTFDAADVAAFVRAGPGVAIDFLRNRFVLRARVVRPGAYPSPPRLTSIRLNTVDAYAVTSVLDESLGGSSGLPFQRFRLANAPVIPESTRIEVYEPSEGGAVSWTETEDLFVAGPRDRVYQLFPATGEILFGDGRTGRIPPPDDGSIASGNIVARRYQYGGGFGGNVGARTLTRVLGLPYAFDAWNRLPARGGEDEEPLAIGLARAPAVVRSRYRAVTATDFEALARETPEARVARSYALANTRPGRAVGSSPGCATIVLVPTARFEDTVSRPIEVSEAVALAVLRYLDGRRLVTTCVFARSAQFRSVTVDVAIVTAPQASLTATRSAVLESLQRYFHALVGGDEGRGWPFGGAVYFSRVFERVLSVDGVVRVERLALSLDGGEFVECRDLLLCDGELLVNGAHVVRARPA